MKEREIRREEKKIEERKEKKRKDWLVLHVLCLGRLFSFSSMWRTDGGGGGGGGWWMVVDGRKKSSLISLKLGTLVVHDI